MAGNILTLPDVNREIAASPDYPPAIIRRLQEPKLASITVSVIYNICSSYGTNQYSNHQCTVLIIVVERAQHVFREHGLCTALINALATPKFNAGPLSPYICALLDFSSQQCKYMEVRLSQAQTDENGQLI